MYKQFYSDMALSIIQLISACKYGKKNKKTENYAENLLMKHFWLQFKNDKIPNTLVV